MPSYHPAAVWGKEFEDSTSAALNDGRQLLDNAQRAGLDESGPETPPPG